LKGYLHTSAIILSQSVIALSMLLFSAKPAHSSDVAIEPDAQCGSFVPGPPLGLACIHCAHPKAHSQAMALAAIMRESCRMRLAVNYLIDGRFGTDDDFLVNHITTLAENRRLMVILYLTNGPSIRRADRSVPKAFAAGLGTSQFRKQILINQTLRSQYRGVVQRALRVKSQVPEHVRFVLSPGLEDNLTDSVFQSMLALTKEVAGDSVGYVRNACPGCAPGNTSGIPAGVMKEVHATSANHGITQGIVTNDGDPYAFPTGPSNGSMPLGRLTAAKRAADTQGNAFILWTGKYQGSVIKDGRIAGRIVPNKRNYPVPTASERNQILSFLRN
jgi:hypothetical protein